MRESAGKDSERELTIRILGIATIGQGLVRTTGELIACRFLLGIFEAGLFPGKDFHRMSEVYSSSIDASQGCVYLISMYYKRYELQWRMSLFFCASILAGAFSGLLAFAIANMGGVAGYGAWRCKLQNPLPSICHDSRKLTERARDFYH